MSGERRLMCVLAHPDDESLGMGGMLARYAAEGVATYLVTATRGERGWAGPADQNPGETALGALREQELRQAAAVLGIREVQLLDYIDGDLDAAPPAEAIGHIVAAIRRVRPQVVATFGPDGVYGHPDHIAISQFTTAALVAAADSEYADPQAQAPHQVAKLYYMVCSQQLAETYQSVFGTIAMQIDEVKRSVVPWNDWMISTRIDATPYWDTVRRAVICHRTQLANLDELARLGPDMHQRLWGHPCFYRAVSQVNGGRRLERDLFEGLPG
jgi:LmbE family N-acetylglucosaminyl deacetylase